jgi:hypothetical protein
MYPFKYCVSLRLWHPKIDPKKISSVLAMKPRNMWKAGEVKQTPKGKKLKARANSTFWCARLHREHQLNSKEKDLCGLLAKTLSKLDKRKTFLKSFHSTGGKIEFFVGLWGAKNFGGTIPSGLLEAVGKLNIDLALDIYPRRFP